MSNEQDTGRRSQRWFRTILITGLLVGLADYMIGFGFFVVLRGAPVMRVLQHPASGVLGPNAYTLGSATALLGIALHFSIAIVWAGLFSALYRASPNVRAASSHAPGILVMGSAAGVVIWLIMNNVVLAFSRGRPYAVDTDLFWIVLALHVPFVGIPLVWATRRFSQPYGATDRTVKHVSRSTA